MPVRPLAGALLLCLACAGGGPPVPAGAPAARELRGTVTYRARVALPEDAVVEVVLADVSRADAPMTVVARQEIRPEGRPVPIPFVLAVDTAALVPRHRYQARASIRNEGRLRFTSTMAYPVEPAAWPETLEIVVEPVP